MFKITAGKGFQLTFDNGWTVSVQWGTSNYCEKYRGGSRYRCETEEEYWKSKDAEIAAWNSKNEWIQFQHDAVKGHVSANEAARFITYVSQLVSDINLRIPEEEWKRIAQG